MTCSGPTKTGFSPTAGRTTIIIIIVGQAKKSKEREKRRKKPSHGKPRKESSEGRRRDHKAGVSLLHNHHNHSSLLSSSRLVFAFSGVPLSLCPSALGLGYRVVVFVRVALCFSHPPRRFLTCSFGWAARAG